MQKTRIEWVKNPDGSPGYSWNPIKGLCPVGCWYCYGKRYYQRFRANPAIRFSLLECATPLHRKKPSGIFVCSTFELFHPEVKQSQRELIFRVIKKCPQHRFYILTKFPENVDRPMPDNVWLGVTSTGYPFKNIFSDLGKSYSKIKFISFEPLLTAILLDNWFWDYHFDWIIVGRLTGYGHKYNPKREWIDKIVEKARKYSIPLFLKDNLKEIWGEPLIQEMPKEGG